MILQTYANRLDRYRKDLRDWSRIYRAGLKKGVGISPRFSYGRMWLPNRNQLASGGMIKFQRLSERFSHDPLHYNVLYLGSSSLPRDWVQLVWLARRRGAVVIYNQDGVAYPGWHGPGWERKNLPQARIHAEADFVIYQSEFCRLSADLFLGKRNDRWKVLNNAIDTEFFHPQSRPDRSPELTLLLGGNQYQYYRFKAAIETVGALKQMGEKVRLLVSGRLNWNPDSELTQSEATRLIQKHQVEDLVELTGTFLQAEAPSLYARADILLHTKYNDPCPSVVIEALSCGVPVVYSASGGVPELVGPDAGIGVPADLDWNCDQVPNSEALAKAVLSVAKNLSHFSAAARDRAEKHLDIKPWIDEHQRIAEELLRSRGKSIGD